MTFRIVPAGDSALTVEFEERIDPAVNAQVVGLAHAIDAAEMSGVRDVVPAFRSMTVYFDPLKTDVDAVISRLEQEAGVAASEKDGPLRLLQVPVCYGGAYGPDLASVAAFAGIDESDVVAIHSSAIYRVFMLGFTPGFAYLASVDSRIAAPRHATPRIRVPAGSIGIAGIQTGVYPSDTPGGWQIVGRTPVKTFNPLAGEAFLFRPGDSVRFRPIDPGDYDTAKISIEPVG